MHILQIYGYIVYVYNVLIGMIDLIWVTLPLLEGASIPNTALDAFPFKKLGKKVNNKVLKWKMKHKKKNTKMSKRMNKPPFNRGGNTNCQ